MKHVILCAALLGMLFTINACNSGVNDRKIEKAVKDKTAAAFPNLKVESSHDTVTLTGVVNSQDEKDHIVSLVRSVDGIKYINADGITINSPAPPEAPTGDAGIQQQIADQLQKAGLDRIKVAVSDREVFLTGTATQKEMEKAVKIANEANPKKVTNQISVLKKK